MSAEPAGLVIRELSVRLPDGRELLRGANLTVAPGDFVLLAGPSGAGKTTLLNLIAGFNPDARAELDVAGRVEILRGPDLSARLAAAGAAEDRAGAAPAPRNPADDGQAVGMVFQGLALFDELSPVENVQFAIDHRQSGRRDPHEARQRLAELKVPAGARLKSLSGGERQRVALARTLAMDTPILLFDEPTTGLDPQRARAVAQLIADTHAASQRAVIVVTHAFEPFLPYAPRLVLLDPASLTLREVNRGELQAYFGQERTERAAPAASPSKERSGRAAWLTAPGEVVLTLAAAAVRPLQWGRPRWQARYLWHYAKIALFGTTAVYIALAGAMLGFVSVYFGISRLPYAHITVPLLTEEFLAAAGESSYRVLAPLLICVLVAGKCGAAFAADIGARRLTQQFEAMYSFGANPAKYLYGNMVLAMVLACPILLIIGFSTNAYASLVAFLVTSPQGTWAMFQRNYMATAWPAGQLAPDGTGWLLTKMISSGVLIAALSYFIGSRPKIASTDVSRDVGRTIFWASLCVLALHSAFSFVEF